jgi:hypothetical protein
MMIANKTYLYMLAISKLYLSDDPGFGITEA